MEEMLIPVGYFGVSTDILLLLCCRAAVRTHAGDAFGSACRICLIKALL